MTQSDSNRVIRRRLLRTAVCQLALVLGLVVVPLRLSHEAVVAERPQLESGDPHPFPGAARPSVRAGECPVELNRLALSDNAVHEHLNIRKRGHEAAGGIRYPCLRSAVD